LSRRLVAEITCLTWTGDGHTVYIGLRSDKLAAQVPRKEIAEDFSRA